MNRDSEVVSYSGPFKKGLFVVKEYYLRNSSMVTDVYSHMQDQDRRDLARKVDSEFFRTSEEPKAEQQTLNPTAQAVIKRMQESPEISAMIVKMMAFFTV